MADDVSDPSYPDDIRAIQRKAFGMLTGYYCGYAFRAHDVRPLMDEIVRLRLALVDICTTLDDQGRVAPGALETARMLVWPDGDNRQ